MKPLDFAIRAVKSCSIWGGRILLGTIEGKNMAEKPVQRMPPQVTQVPSARPVKIVIGPTVTSSGQMFWSTRDLARIVKDQFAEVKLDRSPAQPAGSSQDKK